MTFSIIVPCYNLAPWIRQCLDSVLAQDYQDWECVTVDDESNDGSGDILDEYAAKDSRFKIIHQKNSGEGGARNSGLKIATGEWIFFLDGDDVMLPCSLRNLSLCIDNSVDLIRFLYKKFVNESELIGLNASAKSDDLDISSEIKMPDFCTYVWRHIYRREKMVGLEFKRYIRGCDRVYISDALLHRIDSVRIVDFYCYGYRMREGSAMNSMPSLQVLLDEMDHRLDIMEMIDQSDKKVDYRDDDWLERYFTRWFYSIFMNRIDDRYEARQAWRVRLVRFSSLNGISTYGRVMGKVCHCFDSSLVDSLMCFWIPAVIGKLSRILKRVLRSNDSKFHLF